MKISVFISGQWKNLSPNDTINDIKVDSITPKNIENTKFVKICQGNNVYHIHQCFVQFLQESTQLNRVEPTERLF